MSHDIRTSMNAILGYSQLMKKELTNPKLVHYQEMIEQSSQLLIMYWIWLVLKVVRWIWMKIMK